MTRAPLLSVALAAALSCIAVAQAPSRCEPAALELRSGAPVTTATQWREQRRPELLELFREHMYGRAPAPRAVRVEGRETATALDGAATRKQWRVRYADDPAASIDVLAYLPRDAEGPTPVFLAWNFDGNHTVQPDPGIRLASCWVRDKAAFGARGHRAGEAGRGRKARRWPVETLLRRGYGLVTACYGDVDPDFDDGFENGAHGALDDRDREGDRARPGDAWGAISAWAWGMSRILDSLALDRDFDAQRVAALGHSRLGKTALWAGAQDERFWMVISNDSGCGGAAYSRRARGETVAVINKNFPHWFCRNFHGYAGRERDLPVDQHLLIALCAPRPVYVASAEQDAWADPAGEFLSALGADPVYRLLCQDGLPTRSMPGVDEPAHGRIGYHVRSGEHDLLLADWRHYLDFADRHLVDRPR